MDAYIGEIRIFAGNFPPRGWAFCSGQILPIAQNTALFSILGTQYGGNGTTNFALPNLSGAAPMGQGAGLGLTPRTVGESVGESNVTLLTTEIPAHTHVPAGINSVGTYSDPTNDYWAETASSGRPPQQPSIYAAGPNNTAMAPNALMTAGGSMPHNNMQPYLAMNFIICLNGIFPSRS